MADSMWEIKNRIKSIHQTMKITKAMKLISGVKLKKARQQLEQTKPYFDLVRKTIYSMIENSGTINHKCLDIFNQRTSKKRLIIVFSGDKGLVGGYNTNIIKHTEHIVTESPGYQLWILGNVGRNHFIRRGYNVNQSFDYNVMNPTVYRARDIADMVLESYMSDAFDEVVMLYTRMVNAFSQEPVLDRLLPLEIESLKAAIDKKSIEDELGVNIEKTGEEFVLAEKYLYDPNITAVFDHLMPKYLKGMLYGAAVEAFTCEQNARMTAMDNSTANAEEMIQKLNLNFNRARQASITQEISEIVGGAAALD